MDMVKLKNGSEEPQVAVEAAIESIHAMVDHGERGAMNALALMMACNNKCLGGDFSEQDAKELLSKMTLLQELKLVEPDGTVSTTVRNVVQSSLLDMGLDTVIQSPFADEVASQRADGAKWGDSLGNRNGRTPSAAD